MAEHSWHVADTVLLLAGNFPSLNLERSLALAILHDKLEIFTGDISPLGRDGRGTKTHAFNESQKNVKKELELTAIKKYLMKLRGPARQFHGELLSEFIKASTPEARFVSAVDKLQVLGFIILKKGGSLTNGHLEFTLRYSHRVVDNYPNLDLHYKELRTRLLKTVACHRKVELDYLLDKFDGIQKNLL